MPAFEISRLRLQINELLRHFTQPDLFLQLFRDLCTRYGDFAFRSQPFAAGQIPAYRLNPQVFEYLRIELNRACLERPAAAPDLVKALWRESILEPMLLASYMLGEIPLTPPEVVEELIDSIADPAVPGLLLEALFENGTRRLRREMPDRWLDHIEQWMTQNLVEQETIGMRAMLSVIRDEDFENTPPLFRMLTPRMLKIVPENQAILAEVLKAMAERLPNEAAFYFRQFIIRSDIPETNLRLLRKMMPLLPNELQRTLEEAFQARQGTIQGIE